MIRHIVMWNFKDYIGTEQRLNYALKIKTDIESLRDIIEGIHYLNVFIDPLPSSNADIILICLFETEEALSNYQLHPEHQKIASFVGSIMKDRKCIDYLE